MIAPLFIRRAAIFALLSSLMLAAAPASAARRARLGADLAEKLAKGDASIRTIVHGDRAEVDALARRHGVRVRKYMKHGAVLDLTAGQLAAVAEDDTVEHLSSDLPIQASDVTAESIGADQVWEGDGHGGGVTGKGVGVAVIDSGVDARHSALRNRVVFSKDFTGGDGTDAYGHGTHVAALIAGAPGTTPDTADYRGIASGARIISLRVLDGTGAGQASDVIDAIDWTIDNARAYDIRVINLSLGAPVLQPYKDDPLCEAVERAVSAGIVVVAAAGNYGQTQDGRQIFGAITSPGNDPYVITVGALDTHDTPQRSDDTLAPYSSRGPTMYDLVIKPDLVAPGSHVVSAEAPGSYLAATYPARHVAGAGEDGYIQLSGTSMAAAVVTGAVALVLEGGARLTPVDGKLVLQLTSSLMPSVGLLGSGAGSLNVVGAIALTRSPHSKSLPLSLVAGEMIPPAALYFSVNQYQRNDERVRGIHISSRTQTIDWRFNNAELLGWLLEPSSNTIVWGGTIVGENPIVWGSNTSADTIVWGSANGDTIVWGSSADLDTIVWGSSSDTGTIIWGSNTSDTIVWGSHYNAETIVWGSQANGVSNNGTIGSATIAWGSALDASTIVWGSSDID